MLREATDTQSDPRDDAEGALAAQQETEQVRPRRRRRCSAEFQRALGSGDAQGLDHVVAAAVAGRCLARRSRRGVPADRRALEGLREVSQRESPRLQESLEDGPRDARSHGRQSRDFVEVQQAAESAQLDRDAGRLAAQATDDRRAATHGYDSDTMVACHRQDAHHLVVTCRADHHVRDVVDDSRSAPRIVDERRAAHGRESLGARIADVVIADCCAQRLDGGGADP